VSEHEIARLTTQLSEGALKPSRRSSSRKVTTSGCGRPVLQLQRTVEEVNPDKGRVRVLVSIFGRARGGAGFHAGGEDVAGVGGRSAAARTTERKRWRRKSPDSSSCSSRGEGEPFAAGGPALGQHGVNIMGFCKEFNAATQAQAKEGLIVPVLITIYSDRSFTFIVKTLTDLLLPRCAPGALLFSVCSPSAF